MSPRLPLVTGLAGAVHWLKTIDPSVGRCACARPGVETLSGQLSWDRELRNEQGI